MKIALLTNGIFPYVMGGMEKHSFYIAKYLAQNNVFVDLYHFIPENKIDLELPFSEEELHYIRLLNIKYPQLIKFPGHYLVSNYLYSKNIYKEFINHDKVDFIYAKGFSGWYFLKRLKKRLPEVQIGVNFHGYEMFQKWPDLKAGFKLQILKLPVKYNLKHSDYVFSYGSRITDLLLSIHVKKTKIIEIPTGISIEWINQTSKYENKNKEINYVYVGRYERRKGIEEINKILKEMILEKSFKFQFHFIGPIPEDKKIPDKCIFYHGSILDQKKIRFMLQACDVLVCPSYSEGMPNVILEGMASGCAIIATDVGAVSLMVDSLNGWLIQAGNIGQLKRAFNEAFEFFDNKLENMKRNSLKRISDNFLWEKIASKLLKELESKININ
jgi:glycosyltransferase involved in cell wall biosynthesis